MGGSFHPVPLVLADILRRGPMGRSTARALWTVTRLTRPWTAAAARSMRASGRPLALDRTARARHPRPHVFAPGRGSLPPPTGPAAGREEKTPRPPKAQTGHLILADISPSGSSGPALRTARTASVDPAESSYR